MGLVAGDGWTVAGLAGLGVVIGWSFGLATRHASAQRLAVAGVASAAAVAAAWAVALDGFAHTRGSLVAGAWGLGAWGAGYLMHQTWLEYVSVLVSRYGARGQGA